MHVCAKGATPSFVKWIRPGSGGGGKDIIPFGEEVYEEGLILLFEKFG